MSQHAKPHRGPVLSVSGSATALEAARLMDARNLGAVVVEEQGALSGIFTERDLLRRVVAVGLDPAATRVRDVMSAPVLAISAEAEAGEAVDAMRERHIRHVPVLDRGGKPVGMISLREAFADRVEELQHEIDVLEAYLGYDGVAG